MIQHCGWIGGPEIVIILIVVIILFGTKKIPDLAKGLGKGIRDFKNTFEDDDIKDITSEIKDLKSSVDNLNPKNMLKTDNLFKSKKK
jgi:sec-independent protein translocase protein TatA